MKLNRRLCKAMQAISLGLVGVGILPTPTMAEFTIAEPIAELTAAEPNQSCKIARSVYRDADGKGFELVFEAPAPESVFLATAAIEHPTQGQLYRFNVTQSNGYGVISLLRITASQSGSGIGRGFQINFFDQDLRAATPRFFGEESSAPTYAFMAALGSYDFYQRRDLITENTPPLLDDVIWVFDRCQ